MINICRPSGLFFTGPKLITLSFAILLSAGCAGLVKPVREADRDASGAYDGRWVATHVFTADTQLIQRWQLRCREPAESFGVEVVNGVLSAESDEERVETYVNTEGKFRLQMPTASSVRAADGSTQSLTDGKITVIVQGDLSESEREGLLTFGIAELGNVGCASKYSFAKI